MDVLFATPVPPVLTKPRPHHFIRGLASRGHTVHLLTQVADEGAFRALWELPGWPEIVEACATVEWTPMPRWRSILRCAGSVPTTRPLRVAYCTSHEFAARAHRILVDRGCRLAHVDRERLAPLLRRLPAPKVLDATDSISLYLRQVVRHGMLLARAVSAIELMKMPRFERRMADGYDACLVTTVDDAHALRATGSLARIEVVPNGVPEPTSGDRIVRRQNELVFVGTMSYPPNVDGAVWFAREVLPAVRSHHPGVRLILVGRDPSGTVRRLARTPHVVVTGSVPDIRPFLARGTVFVAPLRIGGGYPNKVAEALGAGIPIVATPAAHRGIPGLIPGVHLLEGRTAPELAANVIRLLDDPGLGRRVGEAARQFAGSSAGWNVAVDRLEEIYRRAEGLVHSGGGPIRASA